MKRLIRQENISQETNFCYFKRIRIIERGWKQRLHETSGFDTMKR